MHSYSLERTRTENIGKTVHLRDMRHLQENIMGSTDKGSTIFVRQIFLSTIRNFLQEFGSQAQVWEISQYRAMLELKITESWKIPLNDERSNFKNE